MERTILHCDCNAFFASVECVSRPELLKVPMAVAGDPQMRHGIILAKNEIAKKYGIKTAETISDAKKKCPDLVLVPPNHDLYLEYSARINAIYEEYTDLVERFGIDESWLDVTHSKRLFGDGKTIADTLRKRIREEIGITISVGVSFNKVFAKLGSDLKKPDATTILSPENYRERIWSLPVEMLLYVGSSTLSRLWRMQIKTIGELARADVRWLEQQLGKQGVMLWQYANGLDDAPVKKEREELKSIGNGMTFTRDLVGEEEVRAGIYSLADSVAARMRKHHLKCTGVQLMIRDVKFKTITRQKRCEATNVMREIAEEAMQLARMSWDFQKPVRMLTVTGISLVSDEFSQQIDLFDDHKKEKEREQLGSAIDSIRKKYGWNAVTSAQQIKNDFGLEIKKKGT